MKTKIPFVPNKQAKTAALQEAEVKIKEAIAALNSAGATCEHWGEHGSIMYFSKSLSEFLSCDNGEGGLQPFVKKVTL